MKLTEMIRYAVTRPSKLVEMSRQTLLIRAVYILFVSCLVGVMTSLLPAAANIAGFGGFNELFSERMPAFNVQDGVLTSERFFDMEFNNVHFYVDTDVEEVSDESLRNIDTDMYFAFGSKRIRCTMMGQELYNMPLGDMLPDGFSNQTLVSMIPFFYICILIEVLGSVIASAFLGIAMSFIYMIMAYPLSRITQSGLNMGNVVTLCYFAQTISIIASAVNRATGYFIPPIIMSIAGFAITTHYILAAFSALRAGTD